MTAGEKLIRTIQEISKPTDSAGELELMVASLCLALETQLGPQIRGYDDGQINQWILDMTRFLAVHRSDEGTQLLVVEVPRQGLSRELPPGTRLRMLDSAAEAMLDLANPLR